MLRIEVVQGDITGVHADAIVNAANSTLLGGGGVDGAIHRVGGPEILTACREIRATTHPAGLPAGDAVATTAGLLPARWVIHTVGPVWSESEDRTPVLRSCYARTLAVADEVGARVVAFPLISAGAYGWPLDDAVAQAVASIRDASTTVETVRMVAYGEAADRMLRQVVGETEPT
ncbi:O-acetyl-ADP-ribose deacetylase (regulator of RNase III) [Mumia flava]|uniref:O-acetyl-ADP-ribose deacetylase (Regulator of RNase III) n=1 Tax=Mumia flava TaxID=1348852 RepID=A0A0B2BKV0_9ACTN|nr:O-acetyl-ADP-ribose deacetylase [Mumia flava]PJJ56437.1 O-acetyl-ADP-ribose deacetylase (regulator of RNase III) [Mumia flava]